MAICHVGYYENSSLIEGGWYKIGALHAICTQSSYRNQGHGSQLILDGLNWAEKRFYDHGHLMVHGSMPIVAPFMIAPLSRC